MTIPLQFEEDNILIICLLFLLYQNKTDDFFLYVILGLLLFTE